MIMEDMVMDGVQALVTEKLRAKWPEVECLIWPSVMEPVAVEWPDSRHSEDNARNIAKMGCVVRRIKLLVENVGETQHRTPVGLARLVEEESKVHVVAAVTRTQRVARLQSNFQPNPRKVWDQDFSPRSSLKMT